MVKFFNTKHILQCIHIHTFINHTYLHTCMHAYIFIRTKNYSGRDQDIRWRRRHPALAYASHLELPLHHRRPVYPRSHARLLHRSQRLWNLQPAGWVRVRTANITELRAVFRWGPQHLVHGGLRHGQLYPSASFGWPRDGGRVKWKATLLYVSMLTLWPTILFFTRKCLITTAQQP